nr:hypothetical protein Iba_chr14aCG24460 [Ipomoea batatas]
MEGQDDIKGLSDFTTGVDWEKSADYLEVASKMRYKLWTWMGIQAAYFRQSQELAVYIRMAHFKASTVGTGASAPTHQRTMFFSTNFENNAILIETGP